MSDANRIPLFPLHTVLYPDGLLRLRIFEPRYVDMVSECLRTNSGFGVVPISSGHETGPPASSFAIGTLATIVDWDQDDDGLLGIVALGSKRFRVLDRSIRRDNLLIGEVRWMKHVSDVELPERYHYFTDLLAEISTQQGSDPLNPAHSGTGCLSVVYRLAELLPLGIQDRIKLLECDDALEKLAHLDRYLRQR